MPTIGDGLQRSNEHHLVRELKADITIAPENIERPRGLATIDTPSR